MPAPRGERGGSASNGIDAHADDASTCRRGRPKSRRARSRSGSVLNRMTPRTVSNSCFMIPRYANGSSCRQGTSNGLLGEDLGGEVDEAEQVGPGDDPVVARRRARAGAS